MSAKSNMQGRALEYAICLQLGKDLNNLSFTENAKKEQKRDKNHFNNCEKDLQASYIEASELVSKWISEYFNLSQEDFIILDRLPDSSGVEGDVTDFVLFFNNKDINFSVKHESFDLKHPRPSGLPKWIEIKDNIIIKKYEDEIVNIWEGIISGAMKLKSNIEVFAELDAISKEFRYKKIYAPFSSMMCSFLNNNISNTSQVKNMFLFLIGKKDFYKIIDHKKNVEILDFSKIQLPSKVIITNPKDHYINLDFNNGWNIDIRLHTASSNIRKKSLKFAAKAKKKTLADPIILKKGSLQNFLF